MCSFIHSFNLLLCYLLSSQLRGGFESEEACDGDRAALFSFRCKDHIVTLFPHLDDESLAGENVGGEASIDLPDSLRVSRRVLFLNGASAEAVGAEAVKDRRLKATHG